MVIRSGRVRERIMHLDMSASYLVSTTMTGPHAVRRMFPMA
jgi:hypothetical protein